MGNDEDEEKVGERAREKERQAMPGIPWEDEREKERESEWSSPEKQKEDEGLYLASERWRESSFERGGGMKMS